jgi:hypothetical protein
VANAQASWPIPQHHVTVSGRSLPAELAAVAVVNVLGSLALLISLWPLIQGLPAMISGVFASEPFMYSFSYMFMIMAVILIYIALAPLAVAYFLLRADPVGRDLQALLAGVILLTAVSGDSGWVWLVLLLVATCTTVLYLSPGARTALRESAQARGVPGPVVSARFLSACLFSLAAVSAVVYLPGLRFIGEIGAALIVGLLGTSVAAGTGWQGFRTVLGPAPRSGRVLITTGCATLALTSLIGSGMSGGSVSSSLPLLLWCAAICALLWGPSATRAWFGARPSTAVHATPA